MIHQRLQFIRITDTQINYKQTTERLADGETTSTSNQVELTQFKDTGEQTIQDRLVISKLADKSNPYPDQTPVQVLSRNYRVATLTWGPGIPTTTVMEFPRDLIAVPGLAERLKPFKWMKAGVRLQVKINATQFHYGAYMISHIPNHTDMTHANTVYQQSGNRPIVLSPSLQNSCTFDLEWINPYNFFLIPGTSEIARVFFTPLTPLGTANSNVTDTVDIQVFASFINPEVSGYIAQAQVVKESISRTERGIAGQTDLISAVLEKIPIIGNIVENFATIASVMDKPTNVAMTNPMEPSFSREMSKGVGLDNTQSLSLHTLAPVNLKYEFLSEDQDSMNILKIAQTPMLNVLHTFQGTLSNVDLLGTPLGGPVDYFQFVARHFQYWRGSIKYKLYFYTSNFSSCRFRISVLYTNTIPDDNNAGDVISRVVDVRGDTEYEFTVPYLWPTVYRPLSQSDALPRIVIQQLIPIVGPSFEEDPQIFLAVWRAAGEDIRFNQLCSYDPNSYGAIQTYNQPPIYEAQMDPTMSFKKTFNPIVDGSFFIKEQGAISGEMIVSLHDVVKRYVTGNAFVGDVAITYPDKTKLGPYHSFSRIFKYWRGSRRLKAQVKTDANLWYTAVLQNPTMSLDAGNGMCFTSSTQWPMLNIEIPWYSSLPFLPTDATSVAHYDTHDNPRDPIVTDHASWILSFVSAGDDFFYGVLIAPQL